MAKWLLVVAVIIIILLILFNLMEQNQKSTSLPPANWGGPLISWMRVNHQTFSLRGQTFFQVGPSAGGYSEIIYNPADVEKLQAIIQESGCDQSVLATAINSLTGTTSRAGLETKLACLGPIVFTPLPFSSD